LANDAHCRTLFTSSAGLENAKQLVTAYKTGKIRDMTPDLWEAKKTIDSTLHPGTMVGRGIDVGGRLT
jgi:hypothetical protein